MLEKILSIGVTNTHFNSTLIKPNGLFIPLRGEISDGHDYIEDAINNGAIATLWDINRDIPEHLCDKITFLKVNDTLIALQELAAAYRDKVNPIVIGVTGSNGKTTTKEFLHAVLSEKFLCHKNSGNYNNHIGVPLTLLNMPSNTEVCITEMGMNHYGEIKLLSKIARPDYGVITNIGESHIGYFNSREGIANAKMEILVGLKDKSNIFYDGDELLLNNLEGEGIAKEHFNRITTTTEGITFNYLGSPFKINTLGEHNVKNAAFAIKQAKILGLTDEEIQTGLNNFKNAPMRLELKSANNIDFLLDCYNSSLTSATSAIQTFKNIKTNKKKLMVLGDILELGDESHSIHRKVGEVVKQSDITCWFVGEEMKTAYHIAGDNHLYFENTKEALNYITELTLDNTFILLKGSRGMKLERVFDFVCSKS